MGPMGVMGVMGRQRITLAHRFHCRGICRTQYTAVDGGVQRATYCEFSVNFSAENAVLE